MFEEQRREFHFLTAYTAVHDLAAPVVGGGVFLTAYTAVHRVPSM